MEQKKLHAAHHHDVLALRNDLIRDGAFESAGRNCQNQFAVANWMSQLGNFANFIAYAVMGIPAGMMLKRIGYKKTALAAVAIGFVGVGIQYLSGEAGSFPIYLIGAFVSGFDVYAQHRRQPDAQYARRRRQEG